MAANEDFQLIHTTINISGVSEPVNFTDLGIHQTLADTCKGSFNLRQEGAVTLTDQIDIYKKLMGKQVDISLNNEFQFTGFITSVFLHNDDEQASEYIINFSGLMDKVNHYQECNSWAKKTFGKIIKELNPSNTPAIKAPAKDTDELFYTVQYNQTMFEFLKMMAIRNGLWMYYDGKELSFDAPSGTAIELKKETDIQDISLFTVIHKTHAQLSGFDIYKGTVITNEAQTPNSSGFVAASSEGGNNAIPGSQTNRHIPYAATEGVLKQMNFLQQQQAHSSTVVLQGVTHNSKLNLGKKIKIMELNGSSGGEYVITLIKHSCPTSDSYSNSINFIPAEVANPPYTDSLIFPYCEAQPAIVVDNEDKDGHDRIKVRFPWQQPTETTPWLSIVQPYAGKNKGMRFIPEKDEEVMVDFISHNAEHGFVLGTIFTGENKSGTGVKGNCIKSLGTRTGRRFEINDCDGTLKMYDNYSDKTPKNGLLMKRKDDETQILLESQKAGEDYSVIALTNEESLGIGLVSGGTLITQILFEKEGKKITIKSDTQIDIQSSTINMTGDNINIKASQELKLEGTQTGVSIKGMKVGSEATSDLSIKGINVAIEATAMLDLSGGAMANLTGALVQIN